MPSFVDLFLSSADTQQRYRHQIEQIESSGCTSSHSTKKIYYVLLHSAALIYLDLISKLGSKTPNFRC